PAQVLCTRLWHDPCQAPWRAPPRDGLVSEDAPPQLACSRRGTRGCARSRGARVSSQRCLPPNESRGFARSRREGIGSIKRARRLGDALIQRYGPSRLAASSAAGGSSAGFPFASSSARSATSAASAPLSDS